MNWPNDIISHSRLLQQNRRKVDIGQVVDVGQLPILLQKSVEACGEP
jgi:hypothetical protein